jgi:pimeloyl-ACP methyl ester carboxylesterase
VHPSIEHAEPWRRRLPGARLEVFDGCGALPHLELPTEFTRRLRPFLQRA